MVEALVVETSTYSRVLRMEAAEKSVGSCISISELASSMSSPFFHGSVGFGKGRPGIKCEDDWGSCGGSSYGVCDETCFFDDAIENLGVGANCR